MTRGLFGPGTIVLGGGAVLMVVFLAIGFFLPATWSATAEATIAAEPELLLEYLDSPEGWLEWTPWPDSITRSGPTRGAGAQIAWESRDFGSGTFRIEESGPGGVRYAVSVAGAGDAVMETRGRVTLVPGAEGTRVAWSEDGDLGRNPLMGYWALSMGRAQSAELEKGLARLAEIVAGAVDSATTGSAPSR